MFWSQVLGFENLVFAIFEFVHALVETPKFKGAVKTGLSELMYYIVLYMQVKFLFTMRSESRQVILINNYLSPDNRGAMHKVE